MNKKGDIGMGVIKGKSKFDSIICFTTILTLSPTLLLPPSLSSLHFTLTSLWRELSFQKLNPFILRPVPAE